MRFVVNAVAIGTILGIMLFSAWERVGAQPFNECEALYAELDRADIFVDNMDMGMNWIGCDHETISRDIDNGCERFANKQARFFLRTEGEILPYFEEIAERTEAHKVKGKRCIQWEDGSYSTK